jgi:H+/Cl- antiporter ClcA
LRLKPKKWLNERLERLRLHLSHPDALVSLALLGLVNGLLAGAVIVLFRLAVEGSQLFRLAVEGSQLALLPGSNPENYEMLPWFARLLLPIAGGLAIGLIFLRWANGAYILGVPRLLERMAYHQGYLTLREFIMQFVGAAIAIISGHSVGREGPHVFLGAGAGSLLGQYLSLPNNSIRTMVGCGTAAGIAASFNTPLAGVFFALEVVMMEYTLASFIPVILAAVSANAISIAFLGDEPAFLVPEMRMGSLAQVPLLLLLGVLAGSVSALFNHLLERVAERGKGLPFWWRTTLAGVLVGLFGVVVPQVMGIGYDTVDQALAGRIGLWLLLAMVLFKILATAASVGMGVPGGMIGPALFIGATMGSLFGLLVRLLFPQLEVDIGFYALLGMGATMGASLQAPLAALTAMMELTYSPQIIMPGMLVIVVAGLTASELFGKESLFITVLKANGMDYNANPVMQLLRKIGVASVMRKEFAQADRVISREQAEEILSEVPEWLLIHEKPDPNILMPAVDLARHLYESNLEEGGLTEIDLLKIPARRLQLAPIYLQASLQEARETMEKEGAEALYVRGMTAPGIQRIYGVLTRETIESAYRY